MVSKRPKIWNTEKYFLSGKLPQNLTMTCLKSPRKYPNKFLQDLIVEDEIFDHFELRRDFFSKRMTWN